IQLDASSQPQTAQLAEVKGTPGALTVIDGLNLAVLEKGDQVTAACSLGSGKIALNAADPTRIVLELPAHPQTVRVKVFLWSGKKTDLPKFAAAAKRSSAPEDLTALSQSGPARWGLPLATQGVTAKIPGPYVIDTLTVPFKNPYKALMFLSGHDFFRNGDAAVCTLHGDVWIVGGIDDKLDKLTWKRFATGLFQPLGLKIVNDQVCVVGR